MIIQKKFSQIQKILSSFFLLCEVKKLQLLNQSWQSLSKKLKFSFKIDFLFKKISNVILTSSFSVSFHILKVSMINHFLLNAKYHNDDNITSRAIFSKRKRKTLQDTQMKTIIERKKKCDVTF